MGIKAEKMLYLARTNDSGQYHGELVTVESGYLLAFRDRETAAGLGDVVEIPDMAQGLIVMDANNGDYEYRLYRLPEQIANLLNIIETLIGHFHIQDVNEYMKNALAAIDSRDEQETVKGEPSNDAEDEKVLSIEG